MGRYVGWKPYTSFLPVGRRKKVCDSVNFNSDCTRNRLSAGLGLDPLWELTALSQISGSFRKWTDITGNEEKGEEGKRKGERRKDKKKGRSQGSIPALLSPTSSPGTGLL